MKNKNSQDPSPSNPNKDDSAFKTLADVTEKLSRGRGDNVAIVAIIAVVLAFIAFIGTFGLVSLGSNSQRNDIPQIPPTTTDTKRF